MDSVFLDLIGTFSERTDIGVVVFDRTLQIRFCNAFVTRLLGRPLHELQHRAVGEAFPDADTGRLRELVAQMAPGNPALRTESSVPLQFGVYGDDVRERHLQSTLIAPCVAVDETCYVVFLCEAADTLGLQGQRSSGQLDGIDSRVLQTEKMAAIGQLAAGVAHEINNPVGYVFSNLKALSGYVQDLTRIADAVDAASSLDQLRELKQSLDYDYIRNDVEALVRESEDGIDRIKRIIGALKDFSRSDEEEMQVADLHRGIDTTLNIVNNELKYKAEVVKEYGELPVVECIPSQINQVVMNLLVNAAQAIEGFGRITLRSRQEGEWVWLEIEDNGPGMTPEVINRIFEPFFTTKPVGKGTGLGLALSYNIVQKHHGRLEVASEPGRGSRFRLWLPIRQAGGVMLAGAASGSGEAHAVWREQ
ncbi:MAG: histidine kinase [Moraxellaceae bacterium]|jgi:signal transduction histidine kinase|nr:histidine kinase [Moraxellaceae bacterium]